MAGRKLLHLTKIRSERKTRGILRGIIPQGTIPRGFGLVPVLLAALIMLTGLGGCRRGESDPVPPGAGPRFVGTPVPSPEGILSIQSGVYYDEEDGTLTCLAFSAESEALPEGGWRQKLRWTLFTAEPGGDEVIRADDLPLDPLASVSEIVIGKEDAAFLFTYVQDAGKERNGSREYFLGRYDRESGELTVSENITPLFSTDGFGPEALCVGGDGTLYVGAEREVLVFTPDLRYLRSIPLPDDVWSLGLDGTGDPAASADIFVGDMLYRGVYALSPEKGEASERFRIRSWEGCGNTTFAPGRDLYLTDRAGIWGVVSKENGGTGEPEMVMDFTASDVIPENTLASGILDEDRIVLTERIMSDEGAWIPHLFLYTRAEETDLSDVTVLTLAYDVSDPRLISKITAFNKAHRDIRVTPLDYGKEGEGRLALDLAAGLIRPDIAVTAPDGDCARMLFEKKLYTDLTPYLDGDDSDLDDSDLNDPGGEGTLTGENLFGAVKHAFDDGEGGLWGLSTGFSAVSLAARRDKLPSDAAERGCWTLSEMTDFAASLPEGTDLMRIPYREYFAAVLTASDGLGEFVDRGAGFCSIDSPEFRRVLEYLVSLPGYEELTASGYSDDGSDTLPYLEGKVILRDVTLQSPGEILGLRTLFNAEDTVLIGLPTPVRRDGAGIRADMNDAVVLTSFCAHPDEGWEVIRALIEGDVTMTVSANGALHDPIPPLRSQLKKMIGAYRAGDMEFRFYFDGGSFMKHGDREHPTDPAELEKPGIVSFFTEEAEAELIDLLDRAGTPIMAATEEEIREMVWEEITALLAGSCTPEECARRIQSRVGIRVAEAKK